MKKPTKTQLWHLLNVSLGAHIAVTFWMFVEAAPAGILSMGLLLFLGFATIFRTLEALLLSSVAQFVAILVFLSQVGFFFNSSKTVGMAIFVLLEISFSFVTSCSIVTYEFVERRLLRSSEDADVTSAEVAIANLDIEEGIENGISQNEGENLPAPISTSVQEIAISRETTDEEQPSEKFVHPVSPETMKKVQDIQKRLVFNENNFSQLLSECAEYEDYETLNRQISEKQYSISEKTSPKSLPASPSSRITISPADSPVSRMIQMDQRGFTNQSTASAVSEAVPVEYNDGVVRYKVAKIIGVNAEEPHRNMKPEMEKLSVPERWSSSKASVKF
eukprot:GHVP01068860.1.p1 GENE.GHVP01068860.1~~GHVP01068860.1.p1  ORF type:complete len:333 (-),score=58.82 GHVP01068860.1:40-1038(-)